MSWLIAFLDIELATTSDEFGYLFKRCIEGVLMITYNRFCSKFMGKTQAYTEHAML